MSAMRRDGSIRALVSGPYAVTIASIAAAALGNVICYKLVAVLGSAHTFSDYSTARRYLTFLLPVALLGAGVALPLRTSIRPDRDEGRRILYLQFGLAGSVVALGLVLLWLVPASVASQIPGLTRHQMSAVLVMVLAFNFTSMIYAYHRGFQEFRQSAWLVVLANGVFPSIGAAFASHGAAPAIWVWAAMCLLLAGALVWRLGWPGFGPISDQVLLLRSSLGRMPGDLAYAAVFLVPVAQMQGHGSAERESVFNYFFVLLGVITAAAAPLSAVLLPVVGSQVARGGTAAAARFLLASICAGVTVGGIVWVVLFLAPDAIVKTFLADAYTAQADVLSSMGPAALGLAVFVFVKSVLDGTGEQPVTAAISVGALVLYFVTRVALSGSDEHEIIVATNLAMGFLGAATIACSAVIFRRGGAQPSGPGLEVATP